MVVCLSDVACARGTTVMLARARTRGQDGDVVGCRFEA